MLLSTLTLPLIKKFGDEKAIETANNQMGENTHMKISVKEMLAQIKSNKKLAAALIK